MHKKNNNDPCCLMCLSLCMWAIEEQCHALQIAPQSHLSKLNIKSFYIVRDFAAYAYKIIPIIKMQLPSSF